MVNLLIAARSGKLNSVRNHIRFGARVDVYSKKGNTPLSLAIENEHKEVTEILLEACTDKTNYIISNRILVRLVDKGWISMLKKALDIASCGGSDASKAHIITKLLESHDAFRYASEKKLNDLLDLFGSTALVLNTLLRAHINFKRPCFIRRLIDLGADVNVIDNKGKTPLILLLDSYSPNAEVLQELLSVPNIDIHHAYYTNCNYVRGVPIPNKSIVLCAEDALSIAKQGAKSEERFIAYCLSRPECRRYITEERKRLKALEILEAYMNPRPELCIPELYRYFHPNTKTIIVVCLCLRSKTHFGLLPNEVQDVVNSFLI